MKDLKVGVIGLGLGRHFVAACNASPLVGRLVICDPDEGRQAQAREQAPRVAAAYASIPEMLDAEKLDVACVVTPDHMHREHVGLCLDAGCHVLMTKPLATSLEDGRAIVRAAESSGRKLMVAHERRFRARFRRVREMLEAGDLGDLILVQMNQLGDRRKQFARAPWYASPEAGRSALVGSGIHEVDLLRFFAAKPILTVAAASNRLGDLDFPKSKTTATVFQFEGGAIGQTAISYEAHWPAKQPPAHFLLVGAHGVVLDDKVRTDRDDDWKPLPKDEMETAAGCGRATDTFLEVVARGGTVPVSPRDGYATLAACIAADESAESGRIVKPDSEAFA